MRRNAPYDPWQPCKGAAPGSVQSRSRSGPVVLLRRPAPQSDLDGDGPVGVRESGPRRSPLGRRRPRRGPAQVPGTRVRRSCGGGFRGARVAAARSKLVGGSVSRWVRGVTATQPPAATRARVNDRETPRDAPSHTKDGLRPTCEERYSAGSYVPSGSGRRRGPPSAGSRPRPWFPAKAQSA